MGTDRDADRQTSDPDAPWRPGYIGPPLQPLPPIQRGASGGVSRAESGSALVHDARPTDEPDDGGSTVDTVLQADGVGAAPDENARVTGDRRGWAVAVGLCAAVAVVVLGVALLLRGGPEERPPGAFGELPERAEQLWSADAADRELMAVGDVVVLDSESRSEATVLDARSGTELWSVDRGPDEPLVAVIDDLVIVRSQDRVDVATYDARTGTPRWTDTLRRFTVPSRVGLLSEFRTGQLEVLRWSDGERVGPRFSITEYFNSHQLAAVGDDGLTTFYDRDTFEQVGPAFDIDPALTRGTRGVVADWLVRCNEDGELVLLDHLGRESLRADPLPTPACGTAGEQARSVIVTDDGQFGVVAAPELLAITIVDDQIEVVWSMRGRVLRTGHSERGAIIEVSRTINGTPTTSLIDVATGEDVSSVLATLSASDVVPAWNGNLLVAADESSLRFVDLEGVDRWRLPLDGVKTWLAGPAAVVLHHGDTSMIAAYG